MYSPIVCKGVFNSNVTIFHSNRIYDLHLSAFVIFIVIFLNLTITFVCMYDAIPAYILHGYAVRLLLFNCSHVDSISCCASFSNVYVCMCNLYVTCYTYGD